MFSLVLDSTLETIYMVSMSTIFALILGFPLGILLVITEKDNLLEKPFLNKILNTVINILRSIPFIILMILILPLSKILVGSKVGSTASIVPLSISAAPFVARLIESNLKEVDKGLIELGLSMGSSNYEILKNILIPESLPSIISSITMTIINLIGYSAMAGSIGGGGLGDLAIRYGHYRFDPPIMIASVIVIVILVQGVQFLGNTITRKLDRR